MPEIKDASDLKTGSSFSGLKDLRPQVSDVDFPFLEMRGGVALANAFGTEEDCWVFGNLKEEGASLTGSQVDDLYELWKNDEVILPIVADLYKLDDGSNLLPGARVIESAKYGAHGVGYMLISDYNPAKEESIKDKVDRIEEFKTSFTSPYCQVLLNEIVAAKPVVETVEELREKRGILKDAKERLSRANEKKAAADKEETKYQRDLKAKKVIPRSPLEEAELIKTIAEINGEIAKETGAVEAAAAEESVVQLKALAAVNNPVFLNYALKSKNRPKTVPTKPPVKSISDKEADYFHGIASNLIATRRREFTAIYSPQQRLAIWSRRDESTRFIYAKAQKDPDLTISARHTMAVKVGGKSLPVVLSDVERVIGVKHRGVEQSMKSKLKLLNADNDKELISHELTLDCDSGFRISTQNITSKLIWPDRGGFEAESDPSPHLRGLRFTLQLELTFEMPQDRPVRYKSQSGEVREITQLHKLKMPSQPAETIVLAEMEDLTSPRSLKLRGTKKKQDSPANRWLVDTQNPVRLVPKNNPLVHHAIDFTFSAGGLKPPGSLGKCARFTHFHATNFLSLSLGFGPNGTSSLNINDMIEVQEMYRKKAAEELKTAEKELESVEKVLQEAEKNKNKAEEVLNKALKRSKHLETAPSVIAARLAFAGAEAALVAAREVQPELERLAQVKVDEKKAALAVEEAKLNEYKARAEELKKEKKSIETYGAEGDARDMSYHLHLIAMGFAATDHGVMLAGDVNKWANSQGFAAGDILVYWCCDLLYDVTQKSNPDDGMGNKKYGHTCMYSENYDGKSFISDFSHGPFVYSKGSYYRVMSFRFPKL